MLETLPFESAAAGYRKARFADHIERGNARSPSRKCGDLCRSAKRIGTIKKIALS
jgi:hypothetical protein